MQPRSLLRICMRVLKSNYRHINMTILPIELAEQLNNFITYKVDDEPTYQYNDYIVTHLESIRDAMKESISIKPYLDYESCTDDDASVDDTTISLALNARSFLDVNFQYRSWYEKINYGDEFSLQIINISIVNPALLQYLLTNSKCVYWPDVPSCCFTN